MSFRIHLLLAVWVLLPVLFAHKSQDAPLQFLAAPHPHIQYWGRWDSSDSLYVRHSWPGVSVVAEFTGTRIGVRMADNDHYWNIYLDGKFRGVAYVGGLPGEHPRRGVVLHVAKNGD